MKVTRHSRNEALVGIVETADRASPATIRHRIRDGWSGVTSGLASGFLQGNLIILPERNAAQFVEFCQINPQACPLLGVSKPGEFSIPDLGADLDLRSDVGAYRIYRDGKEHGDVGDLTGLWRDDFVGIVLGCWFSVEAKLTAAGIRMRHIELGIQGSLFRTNIQCKSSGAFVTNLVVSMRPFDNRNVQKVSDITSRMPLAHGAPIHIGEPSALGIEDIGCPDFGEQLRPLTDETPMFWACGVTASLAVIAARPEIAITHVPGRMVLTDLRDDAVRSQSILRSEI